MLFLLQSVSSCVGWLLGVPESYLPSLEIPREEKTFPFFFDRKVIGRIWIGLVKVRCLHLNQSLALLELNQTTHPWGQGAGSTSFGSFPKEKPAVFAKWKGVGHWVIKTRSATINSTVLISCPMSYNHAVSWPRRSLSSSPALIHITKQHTGKRKREIS